MTILLIRHGETALNVARVLQPADTPLSERGLAQAKALAARLASMDVRAIISSDLPRTVQTAEAISAATGAPVETTPLLQERNFGDWRGLPYDGVTGSRLATEEAPPNGESVAQFERRVAAAFAHVVERQAAIGGNVAVVTHGLVLRAMLASHTQAPEGMTPVDHFGNTSVSVIDSKHPHRVALVNSTEHLDAATSDDVRALSGG
jgi:2,3-bisphosphoglycerate-dependent phosphoglycerate mutase